MYGIPARRYAKHNPAEVQLGEAAFDTTRVARLLRAADGSVRVALIGPAGEFASVPLADRTREGLLRAVQVVAELRARLARPAAPAPPPAPVSAEALADIQASGDARLIELSRYKHLPALAAAAGEELTRRIAAAKAEAEGLENDRLRWAWEAAWKSKAPNAWTLTKALESIGADRGAKNPHDLLNQPRATPVEVRREQLAVEVERTIAEARALMQGARAFTLERSAFEELLPRESGIRSAYTSSADLEADYLPQAREALAYARGLPRRDAPAPVAAAQAMKAARAEPTPFQQTIKGFVAVTDKASLQAAFDYYLANKASFTPSEKAEAKDAWSDARDHVEAIEEEAERLKDVELGGDAMREEWERTERERYEARARDVYASLGRGGR